MLAAYLALLWLDPVCAYADQDEALQKEDLYYCHATTPLFGRIKVFPSLAHYKDHKMTRKSALWECPFLSGSLPHGSFSVLFLVFKISHWKMMNPTSYAWANSNTVIAGKMKQHREKTT